MRAYQVDPLQDPRWDSFLQRHPHASLFHSKAWLESLRKTYGYESVAYTTSPSGSELDNAIVFSRWDPLESTCRHASLSIL